MIHGKCVNLPTLDLSHKAKRAEKREKKMRNEFTPDLPLYWHMR